MSSFLAGGKSPFMTEEHESFRCHVREFFESTAKPHAEEWEHQRKIPRSFWHSMAQHNLLGISYPKQYGGRGLDVFFSIVFLEELARMGFGGIRASISVHQYMATAYIDFRGSDYLKKKYLVDAIAGRRVAGLAITEAGTGSDLSRLATCADRDGDEFILNGEKALVTNGTTADFFTVAARTSTGINGISLFVVDAASRGISATSVEKIGWHSSDTAHITMHGVRVPQGNLIGKVGCGVHYIMHCMQLERLAAATLAVGEMYSALDLALQYMRQRKAFGATLSSFQALRHKVADLVTEAAAAKHLVYNAAWLYQNGETPLLECSIAKLKATEVAKHVVDSCLQMHGGNGYLEEYPIARMYRDIRATTLAGGTSEIMREIIAQLIMG